MVMPRHFLVKRQTSTDVAMNRNLSELEYSHPRPPSEPGSAQTTLLTSTTSGNAVACLADPEIRDFTRSSHHHNSKSNNNIQHHNHHLPHYYLGEYTSHGSPDSGYAASPNSITREKDTATVAREYNNNSIEFSSSSNYNLKNNGNSSSNVYNQFLMSHYGGDTDMLLNHQRYFKANLNNRDISSFGHAFGDQIYLAGFDRSRATHHKHQESGCEAPMDLSMPKRQRDSFSPPQHRPPSLEGDLNPRPPTSVSPREQPALTAESAALMYLNHLRGRGFHFPHSPSHPADPRQLAIKRHGPTESAAKPAEAERCNGKIPKENVTSRSSTPPPSQLSEDLSKSAPQIRSHITDISENNNKPALTNFENIPKDNTETDLNSAHSSAEFSSTTAATTPKPKPSSATGTSLAPGSKLATAPAAGKRSSSCSRPTGSSGAAKRLKAVRKLDFDVDTTSPVSGTIIKDAADFHPEEGRVVYGDIEPSFNLVEVTPEARAELEKIENKIGDYICQLCKEIYEDAFQLAQHRCSRIVHVEYRCPECEKVFNCPANLASHRRWHKPRATNAAQATKPSKPQTSQKSLGKPRTKGTHTFGKQPMYSEVLLKKDTPGNRKDAPWKCHLCGKKFLRQAYLRKHCQTQHSSHQLLASEISDAPNTASSIQCENTDIFKKNSLKRTSSFSSKTALEKHVRTVHAAEHFACKYCSSTFHSSPGLTRHINKCHPTENRQVILLQLPASRP
ncbi:hypothetical protein EGW08_004061, partial [Elysia chlorotica]